MYIHACGSVKTDVPLIHIHCDFLLRYTWQYLI
jgi:hypothetical protein